jgi:RHS repeat-associated protein
VRYASGTTPTDYTYTGQYSYASDFGLMFYNARWYDPYITQFSQPDSIIPDPYNSQDWNRYAYARNNPLRYTDSSGHCIDGITTWACLIAIGAVVLKGIDYGWTGYDMYQSGRTLSSSSASPSEKMFAGLNVALAVIFEAGEPDDLLPVGVPLDDAGRKLVMKGAKEAFEEGGEEGLKTFLKDQLGDHADEVIEKLGLNKSSMKLVDGMTMSTDNALDAAKEFLGEGYIDMGDGRLVSADGLRQVRMGDADIFGAHGNGPHMNFETLSPNPRNPARKFIVQNLHIYLEP